MSVTLAIASITRNTIVDVTDKSQMAALNGTPMQDATGIVLSVQAFELFNEEMVADALMS